MKRRTLLLLSIAGRSHAAGDGIEEGVAGADTLDIGAAARGKAFAGAILLLGSVS